RGGYAPRVPPWATQRELALAAARAAGEVITVALRERQALTAEIKGHGDYVTEVDRAAEVAAIAVLRAGTPPIPVGAEESGAQRGTRCRPGGRHRVPLPAQAREPRPLPPRHERGARTVRRPAPPGRRQPRPRLRRVRNVGRVLRAGPVAVGHRGRGAAGQGG